jgi:predicted DNA-binding protein
MAARSITIKRISGCYEPKIRTMFRLPKELKKRLKAAVRRKKAKSANAYLEIALAERLEKVGIK